MEFSRRQIILAHKNGAINKIRKQLIVEEIRLEYDSNDEAAILRQRDDKPEEFETYNNYVESCKKKVDAQITEILGEGWK